MVAGRVESMEVSTQVSFAAAGNGTICGWFAGRPRKYKVLVGGRIWYFFRHENSDLWADGVWRLGGALRRDRTDVARPGDLGEPAADLEAADGHGDRRGADGRGHLR